MAHPFPRLFAPISLRSQVLRNRVVFGAHTTNMAEGGLPTARMVAPHFRRVVEAIKGHGAIAIQQLYHIGSHGDSDNSFHVHRSPSGLPSYHAVTAPMPSIAADCRSWRPPTSQPTGWPRNCARRRSSSSRSVTTSHLGKRPPPSTKGVRPPWRFEQ